MEWKGNKQTENGAGRTFGFWGWLVGSLCTGRSLLSFCFFGRLPCLFLTSCFSPYFSVARMYSEAPFFFSSRFTVQYGVSLQPSKIGTKARVLIVAQIQLSSQQRGGLHPEQRYSAPVAAHGRYQQAVFPPVPVYRRGKAAAGHKGAQRVRWYLYHAACPHGMLRASQTRCSVQRGWLAQTQCRPTAVLALNPGLCSLTRTRIHPHSHTPRETCRPGRPARIIPGLWSLSVCKSGCAAKHQLPAPVQPASGTGTATGHALRRRGCGYWYWYAVPTRAPPAQALSVSGRIRTSGVIGTYRRTAKGSVAKVRATSGVRRGA